MVEGFTMEQGQTLTRINASASALSFAGACLIVLCYILFKDLRKFSFQLVFYLSLSDMLCSFFNLLGNPGKGFLCYIQSYTTQFFSISSFLWTTTIAFTLHRTVVRHKTDVEELGPLFHLYVWGTSIVMTLIPSIGNDYAPTGAWCWVQKTTFSGKVLRFVTFYVPLWGAVLYNSFTYFQVIKILNYVTRMALEMSDRQRQVEVKVDVKAMNRWVYFPLILIVSWTFGTIDRIHDLISPHTQIFWLYCLHVGTAALMGLLNSIAYGLNASVRRTLREKIDQYVPFYCPLYKMIKTGFPMCCNKWPCDIGWWPEKYKRWRRGFLKLGNVSSSEQELVMISIEDEQT